MSNIHEDYLKEMGFVEIESDKYSPLGKTYTYSDENMNLYYWFYEMDYFVINIHDFIFKKDVLVNFPRRTEYGSHMSISYIKTASAELLNPYMNISNNSILSFLHKDGIYNCLLHGGSPFFSVGFEYKDKYIDELLPKEINANYDDIKKALMSINGMNSFPELESIADEVISYKDFSPASKLFYKLKVREVLSLVLERYYNSENKNKYNKNDKQSIETVTKYIDDHYVANLSLELLSKIAFMSKSKLKSCFKEFNGMTITEYTQRKRISMAEHLILSTDLPISTIAKSVGYTSHSRFSKLFKRYKNIYPSEFKKIIKK